MATPPGMSALHSDPDAAPGTSPFDHYIYVIASDGDIKEGVTSEASWAGGHQQLGNLIVFYDKNHIYRARTPISRRARTWRRATAPTAGTSRRSRAARTWPGSRRPSSQEGHRQAVVSSRCGPSSATRRHQDEHRRRGTGHSLGDLLRGWPPPTGWVLGLTRIKKFGGAPRGHRAHPQAGRPGPKPTVADRFSTPGPSGAPSARSCLTGCWPRNCPRAGMPT